ncbi:hypothetical protein CQW23_27099 [Capsicum baccatum]|uniref:NB-ARC domain-containing protein n=1 Tax=Capsicum baccatum TaxID=33114 RepID=A0A2G2VQN7_CAPBA|nr:hypothetical protein CQW23_27099 [Capsicum baccatum]
MGFVNIQTISYLSPRCCTKEVILRIQNVKKLGINGDDGDYECSELCSTLVHLQQLETLSLKSFSNWTVPNANDFPASLKKLKLEETNLRWSYLDIIAKLPNLEVLKLMSRACRGKEWDPIVRGFNQLKLLIIENNYLDYWKATNDNFPVLEHLIISDCFFLKEIPIEFAEIHSLQLIELRGCLPELGESAARIQKENKDLGNEPVDVRISDTYALCKYTFIKVNWEVKVLLLSRPRLPCRCDWHLEHITGGQLLLVVGTKLEHVIIQLAHEIAEKHVEQ